MDARELKSGDWVVVRSKEDILATLDSDGRLEGMPFMPEMLAYCGKRMRVHRRAHKGCDTIHPVSMRRLTNTVMLEGMRCDGSAHGGCQAQCTVFWNAAWLKPAEGEDHNPPAPGTGCTEEQLMQSVFAKDAPEGETIYRCQTTDFPLYTTRMRIRDVDQYVQDLASKNVTPKEFVLTASYFFFKFLGRPKPGPDGGWYRRFYDGWQKFWGGVPYPRLTGTLAPGAPGPVETLNLQPGDLVRVKSFDAIRVTLDANNKNRGMLFDAEMVPYCGAVLRVRSRVDNFLDEKTGKMIRMKTPAVILEGGWCRSRFSGQRAYCPRAIYAWWREAWLERAPEGAQESMACGLGGREILKQRPNESLV